MNKSPSDQYRQAIDAMVEACNRMQMQGANASAVADVALAAHHAQAAFEGLPSAIMDGDNVHCINCEFRAIEEQRLPYGDRYETLHQVVCTCTDVSKCGAVKACGFYPDLPSIPAYLKRQAS